MIELLGPVDWDEWKRTAIAGVDDKRKTLPATAVAVGLVSGVIANGKVHEVTEAERVALLVLSLGRNREDHTKAVSKAIRIALRDIEQAVLQCEQEIEYEQPD